MKDELLKLADEIDDPELADRLRKIANSDTALERACRDVFTPDLGGAVPARGNISLRAIYEAWVDE